MSGELIQWLGHHFSAAQYVWWTRVQCTAWTLADLVIVFSILRLANLARSILDIERHRFSYGALLATVPLAAWIPFATSGARIFQIELAVTVPHFLIIVYVAVADLRHAGPALAKILEHAESQGREEQESQEAPPSGRSEGDR
ncbi:MAG TPA: hypothetical protein PLO37_25185 [Candidatus Hydrogenedentes bacterium]|nr:hypothetical protein [Candidatus Hydrogenedentota bacterium]HPG70152.1 hypothetical protein [Candidatus Hydrogenedentota bacterium]